MSVAVLDSEVGITVDDDRVLGCCRVVAAVVVVAEGDVGVVVTVVDCCLAKSLLASESIVPFTGFGCRGCESEVELEVGGLPASLAGDCNAGGNWWGRC